MPRLCLLVMLCLLTGVAGAAAADSVDANAIKTLLGRELCGSSGVAPFYLLLKAFDVKQMAALMAPRPLRFVSAAEAVSARRL